MSETLTGCAAASTDSTSRSTKVPVEISSVRPEPGKIALKAPRRTKPPKHIADFDMAGRREFLKELGYQPFRASQLSKHYFERLVNDPAQMTDLPAQDRDEMVSRAMPQLLTPVRTLEADGGDTLKSYIVFSMGRLLNRSLCGMTTASPCVFPRRLDAG